MAPSSQIVKTQLYLKYIKEIKGDFYVPRYQRGYRWDAEDVRHLIDDIWNNKNQDYNLQPIVVKLRKDRNDQQNDLWELIDGQQRITTLYLIFYYMQQQGWKKMGARFSIRYETRLESETYLKTLDPNLRMKNIDYFHLYQAFECIDRWFQDKGDAYDQEDIANRLHSYLYNYVRIIWYEAPYNISDNENDSIALFTRLNVGRIPLTDAELIKALLLSGIQKSIPKQAQEIATQWDNIERDLHNSDIWSFVVGTKKSDDADKYPTRISLLFDTLADPKGELHQKFPRYHTFNTLRNQIETHPIYFWNKILELHALILGWYSNPSLYNKIGFLVATGILFCKLVELSKNKGKKEFEQNLDEFIYNRIGISKSELLNLSYENKNDHSKLLNILLLINTLTVSRTEQRFPFHRHIEEKWSLEHIHAQNAHELTENKQREAWLKAHLKALNALSIKQDLRNNIEKEILSALAKISTAKNFAPIFHNIADRVIKVFSDHTSLGSATSNNDVHSISNLALLSVRDNSELNNAVFEVKRQLILKIDRKGGYIPICTRNVFLKYYTDSDAQQIHFWSPQDRENYLNEIISILEPHYLKLEETDN